MIEFFIKYSGEILTFGFTLFGALIKRERDLKRIKKQIEDLKNK